MIKIFGAEKQELESGQKFIRPWGREFGKALFLFPLFMRLQKFD